MGKKFIPIFLAFLAYRLSSLFLIQTSYVPDEYWQSLEVAHNSVFGYGYLTWEWKEGLRSFTYPFFISILYKICQLLRLDYPNVIIYLPRVFQAIVTAISDQYLFNLCNQFHFSDYWIKLGIFSNWFWYYCGSRTLANTMETSLTIIGLSYYPWGIFFNKGKKFSDSNIKRQSVIYLSLSALNFFIRPTTFTLLGPLFLFHLWLTPLKNLKEFFVSYAVPAFLLVVPACFALDLLWYRRLIFPAFNFLHFNIFKGISSFYGTHPFYWYFTEGLPVVLGFHYIPFLFGIIFFLRNCFKSTKSPHIKIYGVWLFVIALNILILSYVPHKEFRFALPIMPLMMLVTIKTYSDFFTPSRKKLKVVWTIILVNGFLLPALLIGLFHQRGTLDVMSYLRKDSNYCQNKCHFLFLMPCHSTPLYTYLHFNATARFLKCDPPISPNHYDESKEFFNNPVEWLKKYWDDKDSPTHVIFFDNIENKINNFLVKKDFLKEHEVLHSIFLDNKKGRLIVVYEPS